MKLTGPARVTETFQLGDESAEVTLLVDLASAPDAWRDELARVHGLPDDDPERAAAWDALFTPAALAPMVAGWEGVEEAFTAATFCAACERYPVFHTFATEALLKGVLARTEKNFAASPGTRSGEAPTPAADAAKPLRNGAASRTAAPAGADPKSPSPSAPPPGGSLPPAPPSGAPPA